VNAPKRITYYTRKVAELSAIQPLRREAKHKRRSDRLYRYKLALNARLRGGSEHETH
jgi:hypothetical protein